MNDRPSKRPCYRVHYLTELLDDEGSSSSVAGGDLETGMSGSYIPLG